MRLLNKRGLMAASVLAAGLLSVTAAYAQEKKDEEPPFWAIGKPKTGPGAEMAPVAAPPVATAADKLPKLKGCPVTVAAALEGGALSDLGAVDVCKVKLVRLTD